MSALRVSLLDKRIIEYIECGGVLETPQGAGLITKLITEARKDHKIEAIISSYDIDLESLALMYAFIVKELLPDPLINAGGEMLTPTLFFMEPDKLERVLNIGWDKAKELDDRRAGLFMGGIAISRIIYDQHLKAYGPTKGLNRDPNGSQEKADQMLKAAAAAGCLPVFMIMIMPFLWITKVIG